MTSTAATQPAPSSPRHLALATVSFAVSFAAWGLMWLLTATLEAYLAGHREGVLPAAVASAVLLLACAGLYLFVDRIDREVRRDR